MDDTEVRQTIESMVRSSMFGGIPIAATKLARERLGLSFSDASQCVQAIYDSQPPEWRAEVEGRGRQVLIQQLIDAVDERLKPIAQETGHAPEYRKLSQEEATCWELAVRTRFQAEDGYHLWCALNRRDDAEPTMPLHLEIPAREEDPNADTRYFGASKTGDSGPRAYKRQPNTSFAEYLQRYRLPFDGSVRIHYESVILEMSTADAALCLHAIYGVLAEDVLVVDTDLRWVVCIFHHGTTRLLRQAVKPE